MSKILANNTPKKNIAFISYYFPPMGGGGVQRIVKTLKYWDYENYSVSVLTVKASYFYAEDSDLYLDIPPQVNIERTSSLDPFRLIYFLKRLFYPFKQKSTILNTESGSYLRKITAFLFVPDSRILWFPFALKKIRELHKNRPIDFLVATMPPFTCGVIGWLAKRLYGIPYVLDFRDSWTNNPYLIRVSFLHQLIQNRLEKLVVKSSTSVVFVNPNLRKSYFQKYSFLKHKPTFLLRNGYDRDDFKSSPFNKRDVNLKVLKIGILGTVYSQGNAPLPLLKVIQKLIHKDNELVDKLRVVFIGKWATNFLKKVKKFYLGNVVEWIPYLPHKELLVAAQRLDVLALAIDDSLQGSGDVTPGRIYEYLFLKKPILAMCPLDSDLANLIRENIAGEVLSYSDIENLESIIFEWIKDDSKLKTYYRSANLDPFDRKYLTQTYIHFLTECFKVK